MTEKSLKAMAALMGLVICGLTSCASSQADVRYPTVQEMDALDVQWGLDPRKTRGTPTRSYRYDSSSSPSPAPAAVQAPVDAAPAVPEPPLEVQTPAPQSQVIPDSLR